MLRLRMLTVATFVVLSVPIRATQISEAGSTPSLPSTLLTPWTGILDFQWPMSPGPISRIADQLANNDAHGYVAPFLPDLFLGDFPAEENDTAAVSTFRESEPKGRLTFTIFIFLTLGVLLKYLSSPAFSELLSDVSFMFFAIEHEGRDLKSDR
jgi:hypothetical protein